MMAPATPLADKGGEFASAELFMSFRLTAALSPLTGKGVGRCMQREEPVGARDERGAREGCPRARE